MTAKIIEMMPKSKGADAMSNKKVTCFIFANPCTGIIRRTIKLMKDGVPVLKYLGKERLYNTFLFTGQDNEDTPFMAALVPSDNPSAIRWYAKELETLAQDIENGVYDDVPTYSSELVETTVAANNEGKVDDD